MKVDAGPYASTGTMHTIHADQPLSREQVDLLVRLAESVGQDIHTTRSVEMDEGHYAVEWWHAASKSFHTTTVVGGRAPVIAPGGFALTVV